jgi:DNA-binding beta-propeller fold protein YncE
MTRPTAHRTVPVLAVTMALLGALAGLAGCGTPPGVVFPPPSPPIVFPPPPEVARVSWVGQLVTEADLKPGKSGLQGIAETLFGKEGVRSMLTPMAVCTDGKSRVFVADSNAQVVHVFDLDSRRYARWAPGPARPFSQPVGLAWDPAGRLLVADSAGSTVYVFVGAGKLVAEWGGERFGRPCGVAVDPPRGRVIVVDAAAHGLVELSLAGEVVRRVGRRGAAPGEFNYPTNVTVDRAGRVYVSDTLNFRVQQLSPELEPVRQIGSHGDMPGYFAQPKGVATDSEGHVYVVDGQFESVQVFDDRGRLLLDFGEEGNRPAEFWLPAGIFVDGRDRIWVADSYNRRIQVFDYHARPAAAAPPAEVKP